jgi:hypothetical protein
MEQPKGYVTPPSTPGGPEQVALVQKALYGTMNGANNWWKTLNEDMQGLGYYCSLADTAGIGQNQTPTNCEYTVAILI